MLRRTAVLLLAIVASSLPAVPARAGHRLSDDPLVARQWHLGPRGIDVAGAWGRHRGARPGHDVVAVVDTGVDLGHRDLQGNRWTNPGEVPGNGIDDEGNGRVDDVHGWDWVDDDADPADGSGHGTHVAGVVAARGGNRIGVTGVAQRARVMALRVLDPQLAGDVDDVTAALRYAVAGGARVVNLSLDIPSSGRDLDAAIGEAAAAGVLVVVAAGNAGRDLRVAPSFPACSARPNVITVTAFDRGQRLAPFANYGRGCVDVAAPGEGIAGLRAGGGYARRGGTSTAAPQVAGAALLLLAADPRMTPQELVATLSEGGDGERTIARLDVSRAMRRVAGAARTRIRARG